MNVEQEPRETNDPDDRDACEALLFRHHPAPILLFFLYSLGRRDRWPSQSHEWTHNIHQLVWFQAGWISLFLSIHKDLKSYAPIFLGESIVLCGLINVFVYLISLNISYGGGKEKKSRFNTTNKTQDNENHDETTQTFTAGWILFFFVIPSS